MKKNILFAVLIFPFIFLKITNLGIRLSDTNIYFNIAYRILHGQIPYRDFFFANFPLFAYISYLYYFIAFGNINLFYLTSVVETIIITFLIYKISYSKTKNSLISIISSLLYLYSFIVLSTSDHQTGVTSASLFAVLAYYFFQRKAAFFCGVFAALSFFTKAYFFPISLSFFFYLLIKKEWKNFKYFITGFILTGILTLLPFIILSPQQFISDIFGFSLTRPAGIQKNEIIWFFVTKDFILFLLFLFNLINIKKNLLFSLITLFSILFFIGYQDIYYLYLNFIIPFLCISFYEIYFFLNKQFRIQKLVIPTIILIFIILNLVTYISNYRDLQKINDIDKIISSIKEWKPNYLYGYNGLTPALSVITDTPALSNVNDAYVYFFRRGIYNKELLTSQAISTKTMVVAQGANYPEFNIRQDILDNEIIDQKRIYEHCKNVLSVPLKAEGWTNRINLFKCY
jgi:hypothetical protein